MSASGDLIAGRYRLVSQIGRGGMGRVWLARDETLHRDVAVKEVVLPRDLAEAERYELRERTLREARAAGRLSHPNVVAVYDVIQAEDRPWIVMELVRSRSLYEVIRDVGPVPPRRAAEIGLAVLAALTAAHEAGVWHRDVKPGNVLLADDGRVVLTDFGLATYDGDGTVTRSGLILGSAQYIAPERARDGASGPESDMWSLGATLYAAVEGRSPYAREASMATLTALATQPPDPPRRAGPLAPVLLGLLRKNPRHRMRQAEAERLLRKVVAGENISRRKTYTPPVFGYADDSSAQMLAPNQVSAPAVIQTSSMPLNDGTALLTSEGWTKIDDPTIVPTTIAVAWVSPIVRASLADTARIVSVLHVARRLQPSVARCIRWIVAIVSVSAAVLSSRYRLTRANRSVTAPGYWELV